MDSTAGVTVAANRGQSGRVVTGWTAWQLHVRRATGITTATPRYDPLRHSQAPRTLKLLSLHNNEVLHDLLTIEGEVAQCGTRRGHLLQPFQRRRISPAAE